MTYVGATPTTGDFKLLDSITTSSTTTFNLRQGGVAVYPQSANHCIVQLNGINQVPGSSFNIVNDTIVFASSLSSSDVINQILVLGNVNDIGVPSDDTVSTAKIQSLAVSQANIADQAINEAKLQVSNAPTNGYMLTAQSGNTGGLTWAEAGGGSLVYLGGVNASNHNSNKIQLQQVFSSDYQRYKLMAAFQGTSAGAVVEFRWLKSDNTEFTTGVYHTIIQGRKSDSAGSSVENNFDWGRSNSQVILDQATGSHIHKFTLDLFPNQNDNVNYPTAMGNFYSWLHNSAANKQFSGTIGLYTETTTSVAGGGVQLEATSGNFGTVNVAIWGYKDS